MTRQAGPVRTEHPPAVIEGARLFDARSYYESHDVLEEEWAEARGPRREVLKALVKVAAGMYHLQTSGFRGAESLLSSGLEALDALPPGEVFVEVEPLRGPVRRYLDKIRSLRAGDSVEWEEGDVPRMKLRSRPAPRDSGEVRR